MPFLPEVLPSVLSSLVTNRLFYSRASFWCVIISAVCRELLLRLHVGSCFGAESANSPCRRTTGTVLALENDPPGKRFTLCTLGSRFPAVGTVQQAIRRRTTLFLQTPKVTKISFVLCCFWFGFVFLTTGTHRQINEQHMRWTLLLLITTPCFLIITVTTSSKSNQITDTQQYERNAATSLLQNNTVCRFNIYQHDCTLSASSSSSCSMTTTAAYHDSSNRILPEPVLCAYLRSSSSCTLLRPPLDRSSSTILLGNRTEVAQKLLGRISKTEVEKALYRGLI